MARIFDIALTQNLPWQTFNISLSGVVYGLEFRYNTRTQTWTMDILDTNGDLIIGGLPLLIERDITKQYRHLSVPEGTFIVKDNTGKGTQPGQFSFGNTHTLYYVDPTQ